jgi:hypothetical protein
MLDAMETVEIKFEDGREVQATSRKRHDSPEGRPAVIARLLGADCSRCHGSGKEPGRKTIPFKWDHILEQLAEAGDRRAAYSDARGASWESFKAAWDTIRELWPRAQAMGVPQGMAAQAVGVTRAQFSAEMNRNYEERVANRTQAPPVKKRPPGGFYVASESERSQSRLPTDEIRKIRQWAADNAIHVEKLGTVPNAVIEAYQAAHPDAS